MRGRNGVRREREGERGRRRATCSLKDGYLGNSAEKILSFNRFSPGGVTGGTWYFEQSRVLEANAVVSEGHSEGRESGKKCYKVK